MSVHYLVDLLTIHGFAHLATPEQAARPTQGRLSPFHTRHGGALSAVDTLVQRCDGPRRLCDYDDDNDEFDILC